ncbi:uncharacterized protein LOC117600840 isoform X2 [Osmia lignaria lignaria]|uniref:uncharacterized protein LOC117600840 isoform X2 n=1 Tax=Osmia lignaria lignaria TaxID=1437193 RepID=UPI0014787863|nr:uncharacterized protein LOC117600840 isoform X2 [Osmia lignaria]
MAVSASFHRNVLLLSQVIQPNDEFKKHFRKGMFDKPNTAGFIHVSHYLLTIYDSERFKKLIEWPIICKKTEVKYRNSVKNYLISISVENSDIGFPNILMSHLIHAGGNKFTIIMWKLSQVVLRKYIARESMISSVKTSICYFLFVAIINFKSTIKTSYSVMFAPQARNKPCLAKKFIQETNLKTKLNISNHHKNLSEMENATKTILEEQKKTLSNIVTEIFEREQFIETLLNEAPVHSTIKKCLSNINDEEVIKMWQMNITDGINRIQKKNALLKSIEQLGFKVNNIVLSNSNNVKVLDAKQIQKINCSEISELFSIDTQCLLFQSYKNDKLILNNFIVLFNSLLTQLHQLLKINTEDISKYLLQVEASCEDMKAAFNIIQTYVSDIAKLLSESQDMLYQNDLSQVYDDSALPMMSNVLLMVSPLIKFDTNYTNEECDLQKRLQLTPVEGVHKSLFSRYERLKKNHEIHISKLRENLFVSRINFDDTISTINNENPSLHMQTIFRRNLSSLKPAKKYSRLFSNRTKRSNRRANLSIMSMPCSSEANSTAIVNAIEEMHDVSQLSLDTSAKSPCNINVEFATPDKLTVKENKLENTPETGNVLQDFQNKINILDICETMEVEINNDYDNNPIKTEEKKGRRHSISDLVDRYKKLLELNNRSPSSKINCVKYNNE